MNQELKDFYEGLDGTPSGSTNVSSFGYTSGQEVARIRREQEAREAERRRASTPASPSRPLLTATQALWLGRISTGGAVLVGLAMLAIHGISEALFAAVVGAVSGAAVYVAGYAVAFSVRLVIRLMQWAFAILVVGLIIHVSGIADLSGLAVALWADGVYLARRWL